MNFKFQYNLFSYTYIMINLRLRKGLYQKEFGVHLMAKEVNRRGVSVATEGLQDGFSEGFTCLWACRVRAAHRMHRRRLEDAH